MLCFAKMSDPAVKYLSDKAVEFLDAGIICRLADKVLGAGMRWAGRTCMPTTAADQRTWQHDDNWQLRAVYNLGRGGFTHFELTDCVRRPVPAATSSRNPGDVPGHVADNLGRGRETLRQHVIVLHHEGAWAATMLAGQAPSRPLAQPG
jgi:hypothetical protein